MCSLFYVFRQCSAFRAKPGKVCIAENTLIVALADTPGGHARLATASEALKRA